MPVQVVGVRDVPKTIPTKDVADEDYQFNVDEAQACLDYLIKQGFPDVQVNLVLARAQFMGLEYQNRIWVFSVCGTDESLHRTITHEYGHWVHKHILDDYLDEYFNLRGGKTEPTQEIFAEDFRFLFGTELAQEFRHNYYPRVRPPTGERREKLRKYIMDAVKTYTEAPSNEKAGASKFIDIQGHWAEAAILKVSEVGLMNGYPDGTFGPDKPITRAEIATILARLIERSVMDG